MKEKIWPAVAGAVIALVAAMTYWIIWEEHQAPRPVLVDVLVLSISGILCCLFIMTPFAGGVIREERRPWVAHFFRATCGALLGATLMGFLAIAPWLVAAAMFFAVAALKFGKQTVNVGRGRWRRSLEGLTVIITAALLNSVILWFFLFASYSPVPPDEFLNKDFYVNSFLEDVPLHDIWVVHLEGGGEERTIRDVREVMAGMSPGEASPLVIVLVAARGLLGWIFGWDEEKWDEAEVSYSNRLADVVRGRSIEEPGAKSGYFRMMYTLEHESVGEILNRTVHAFFVMALEQDADGHILYWGIFVKEEKTLTPFYMGLIDPFRRLLVHPSILRAIDTHWRAKWEQP